MLVELLYQTILVQSQQLGVRTNVAAGECVARQLTEVTCLYLGQGSLREVELLGDCREGPVFTLALGPQRFARIAQGRRGSGFRMGRYHRCSERNC